MKDFRPLFEQAQSEKLLSEADDAIIFYNLGALRKLLHDFSGCFPSNHIPSVAVKTCPLSAVLAEIGKCGFGHEAASVPEALLAAKHSSQTIIYDGPAKKISDLKKLLSLQNRLIINANSFQDLQKIRTFRFQNMGLRINPQVSPKVEKRFDVSQSGSQFGVPLIFREEIIEAFTKVERLNTIHFHLGSGMTSVKPFEQALVQIETLIGDIELKREKKGWSPLSFIDIGGGLLADEPDRQLDRAQKLGTLLQKRFYHLWEKYRLATEMGQYFHTHCASLFTQIADVLHHRQRPIIIAHTGANMFPRQAYTNSPPPFKYSILNSSKNQTQAYDIAGPLCFAGDRVAENVMLPSVQAGDWLVIDAVGANTFSLYSMHCSWPFPKVIGYDTQSNKMSIIKDRMSIKSIIDFWS